MKTSRPSRSEPPEVLSTHRDKEHAIDVLIPNFADLGAQRVAINAANGLFERGYRVRFVVNERCGPFDRYLNSEIEVLVLDERIAKIPKLRVLLRVLAYVRSVPRDRRSTLISFAPIMNVNVIIAGLLRPRARSVIQEHAFQSVALADRSSHSWLFEFLYRTFLVRLYHRADLFLTIAEAIRKDFVESFGLKYDRTHVIANPVDIERIGALASESPHDFEFLAGRKYLIGIGRLEAQKNFHRLIRIFARVAGRHDAVDLVILGKGELHDSLQKLVHDLGLHDRVHLLGFKPNPYAFLSRSTLFCLSSDWEGLPQVIAEAMICGTPVVSHACKSGPDEMIHDYKTGRLVPYDDESAFADAVLDLLSDDGQRRSIGEQAREWSLDAYSMRRFIDSYEEVIHNLHRS